jgi:hypothetical protein
MQRFKRSAGPGLPGARTGRVATPLGDGRPAPDTLTDGVVAGHPTVPNRQRHSLRPGSSATMCNSIRARFVIVEWSTRSRPEGSDNADDQDFFVAVARELH